MTAEYIVNEIFDIVLADHWVKIRDYWSGVQITFRRLTKVGATSKFWLKLADVKRHCRKVGHLSTT